MTEFDENEDVRALVGLPDGATPDEDSEIDFDDESDDDQLPLDEAEAAEIGANLDDPESDEDDLFL
ncbi:MAG: hypothetical protein ABSE47_04425 [Acidimicrobiales bacterium]|jgi:hypothetical protein